jgi:ferredoxin
VSQAGAAQWRVTVDGSLCMRSGLCVGTAPDAFVLERGVPSRPNAALIEPDETVRAAAAQCPVEAIALTDTSTGEPVPFD